jgi:hypothetical protein
MVVVTLRAAVAQYEAGALAMTARGTQHTYGTWTKRLVTAHGDRAPGSLTAGDLTDLIAVHVLSNRSDDEGRRSGRSAEENAVGAFRHLWTYLVEKGYAQTNVALRLKKPRESSLVAEVSRSRRQRSCANSLARDATLSWTR